MFVIWSTRVHSGKRPGGVSKPGCCTSTSREDYEAIESGQQGFVSVSNLACVLETSQDIGEGLPEEQAAIRKASYLLFNLVNLHPFLDGNKRTAFEVAKTFLNLNGWMSNTLKGRHSPRSSCLLGRNGRPVYRGLGSKESKQTEERDIAWPSRYKPGVRRR